MNYWGLKHVLSGEAQWSPFWKELLTRSVVVLWLFPIVVSMAGFWFSGHCLPSTILKTLSYPEVVCNRKKWNSKTLYFKAFCIFSSTATQFT